MLVLWGDEDPNGGAEIATELVGQVPDAELEILPGAGHAPWIDDPEHVVAAIERFLGQ